MNNETQPLLGHEIERYPSNVDGPQVDFDPNGDPENPMDWPKAYKLGVVALLAFMAFTVTFTCIGIVPVAERIVYDLEGKHSKSSSILLVTVWELGEAAGPLLIAPLSEIYGRYPVFNAANILFIFGVLLQAFTPDANLFIFARFLTGFAVASNVLNPAIIGDIYPSEQRGSGMSLIMLAPLLGGAVGPAISGAIAETLGWRKILWMAAVLAIICELVFFALLRETYKIPILKRRAARLRKETGDETLKCAWDEEGEKPSDWSSFRVSIIKPLKVMSSSFVLQIMSIYGGLVFTLYYVIAVTFPGMLTDEYGFSPAQVGAAFLSFTVGATAGIVVCNLLLDRIYIHLGKVRGGASKPEYRLPLMIAGGFFLPLALAFYGWVPYAHWPVSLLFLAVAIVGFIILVTNVPMASYVVDAFGLDAASAMTYVMMSRCLAGTLLPLAIPPLEEAVGKGYSFLVFAAALLALAPIPLLVMRYGAKWRQKSVYSRDE